MSQLVSIENLRALHNLNLLSFYWISLIFVIPLNNFEKPQDLIINFEMLCLTQKYICLKLLQGCLVSAVLLVVVRVVLIGMVHVTGILKWDLTQLMDLRTYTVQILDLGKDREEVYGVLQPCDVSTIHIFTPDYYVGGLLK